MNRTVINFTIAIAVIIAALLVSYFLIKTPPTNQTPTPTNSISPSLKPPLSMEAQKAYVLKALKISLPEEQSEAPLKTLPQELTFLLQGAENPMIKSAIYVGGRTGYHIELDFDFTLFSIFSSYAKDFLANKWARLISGRHDNFAVMSEKKYPYTAIVLFYNPDGNKTHIVIDVLKDAQ